jgi:hypothetical protein
LAPILSLSSLASVRTSTPIRPWLSFQANTDTCGARGARGDRGARGAGGAAGAGAGIGS